MRYFEEYLLRTGMPWQATHIRREHVEGFIAELLEHFRPSTAKIRYGSLQQLFPFPSRRWQAAGESDGEDDAGGRRGGTAGGPHPRAAAEPDQIMRRHRVRAAP